MATSEDWKENPYIIGRPIYEPEYFFGREELFQFIQDNLNKSAKVILLHGQRRIGKSSVLCQIPNFVHLEKFVFVSLSLEGKSQKPLSEVLHELARDIIDHLGLPKDKVTLPTKSELEKQSQVFADDFLPQIYQVLGGKNLVLLLDEFDVLGDCNPDTAANHFFPYLQSIVYQQPELFIIPVVGRRLTDMPTLLGLFREAPRHEIGLLDRRGAERLIIEPAKGVLEYNSEVIDAILALSAGHPYFTQVICFALFANAREEQRWQVTRADVESIVDKAIEIGEGGLAWFRDGLPIPERVFFSAVAEAQQERLASSTKDGTSDGGVVGGEALNLLKQFGGTLEGGVVEGEALNLLKQFGVILTEPLRRAEEQLLEWNFLQHLGLAGNPLPLKLNTYKVAVELVRRWLVKRYSLRREIFELENLDQRVHHLYEVAALMRQRGDTLNAIRFYKQALTANPNHFSVLFDLAEAYLDVQEFDQAVELNERAYKVDSIRTKEGFIQSLLLSGRGLMLQGKFELGREQFSQVLLLQPNNQLVKFIVEELRPKYTSEINSQMFLLYLEQAVKLSDDQKVIIEAQINAWTEYQRKLEKYRDFLLQATHQEEPLSLNTRSKLDALPRELRLKGEDVIKIRKQFIPQLEAALEKSKSRYRQEVESFVIDGNISPIARRILNVMRNQLELLPEEANEIEREILKPYQDNQRKFEEYLQVFTQAIEQEFPLSESSRNELKQLQAVLQIGDKEVFIIEATVEIQSLLKQLAEEYSDQSADVRLWVLSKRIQQEIKQNPTLKGKLLSAIKLGGLETLKAILNYSLAGISSETIQSWLEVEED
ncbi:AAA family ATPase [Trichocoleus sp. Lan]|uniref:tetratricopeptide repeat protein n=1 Tax=Trichocoleus sp. Lan TaxID=2933927 RepID=UPI0032995B3C